MVTHGINGKNLQLIPGAWQILRACLFSLYLCTRFPGGSDSKKSADNAGDLGSILGLVRSPGGQHGNPF